MSRKRRPRGWFYLYVSNRDMFKLLNPAAVGRGLIAACEYFVSGELPKLDDFEEILVFTTLRSAVDESLADYKAAVEGGKLGPAAKEAKQEPREDQPP